MYADFGFAILLLVVLLVPDDPRGMIYGGDNIQETNKRHWNLNGYNGSTVHEVLPTEPRRVHFESGLSDSDDDE